MKNIDSIKRDHRTPYYKPFILMVVADLVSKDQDLVSSISIERILNEFKRVMEQLDKKKSNKGHMPLWHCCTDDYWSLYKNNKEVPHQGMSKANPKSNTKLLEVADDIILNPDWNDIREVSKLKFDCLDQLHRDYLEKEDLLTKKIIDFYVNDTIPLRQFFYTDRFIRNSKLIRQIKDIYQNQCQICNSKLHVIPSPYNYYYSEGAHIKPLGSPHDGPDELSNILCLCPNHHVQFDYGFFSIDENMKLISSDLSLNSKPLIINSNKHKIDREMIKYHRESILVKDVI